MLAFLALVLVPTLQDSPFAEVRRAVPVVPTFTFSSVQSVTFGDVDGDGAVDAVLSHALGSTVFRNEGFGTFVEGAALPGGTGRLADVNGDQIPDLLLAVFTGGQILLGDGSGGFAPSAGTLPGNLSKIADVGDVDSDGDLDVWLSGSATGVLWLNDGSANFTNGFAQIPLVAELETLSLGDIDADGDLDALLVRNDGTSSSHFDCSGPAYPTLLLNDGSGTYTFASGQLVLGTDSIVAGSLDDLDGDGDLDALVMLETCVVAGSGGSPDRTTHVFLNDGGGTFAERLGALPTDLELDGPFDVSDIDGDGAPDLWVGDPTHTTIDFGYGSYEVFGDQNRLFLGDGTGAFSEATNRLPQVENGTQAGGFVDVDGDGDDDIWNTGDGDTQLLLSDGKGHLADAAGGFEGDYRGAGAFASADVNGDGYPDVFVGRNDESFEAVGPGSSHLIYLGDGRGGFTELVGAMPERQFEATSATFGDIDEDGDPDLLVTLLGDGDLAYLYLAPLPLQEAKLFLNDGTGHFTELVGALPEFQFVDRGHTTDGLLADLDGDGHLDVVLIDSDDYDGGSSGPQVYLGDGAGNFTDVSAASQFGLLVRPYTVEAVDLDADTDLDLVVFSFYGVAILENDGTATFTNVSTSVLPVTATYSSYFFAGDVGDLNGDGAPDLVTARFQFDGDVRAFVNDGSGQFTEVVQPSNPQSNGFVGKLADVDGDDDLDLLTLPGILLNDGTGVFSDPGLGYPTNPRWRIDYLAGTFEYGVPPTVADLDLDGDDDLFGLRGGNLTFGDRLGFGPMMNLSRHVSWHSFPRLGAPLQLDLTGPPNGAVIVLAAAALLPAPLQTGIGFAHIDGNSVFLTRLKLLDANGRATFGVAMVANDPDLAGVDIHWQTLVGPPFVFANYETTTLSTF
jgi:hypothetical protein